LRASCATALEWRFRRRQQGHSGLGRVRCIRVIRSGDGRMTPFSANIFAFLSAFLVSYFGHSRFTYKSTAPASRSLPRFFAVASGGLFLNQAIVYLAVDVLGWQYITALVIVVSTVPVIIYFLGRVWAFRE
ncbi:MAG: GtrA family protein, partial [Rhodobacteraceae bacterium]